MCHFHAATLPADGDHSSSVASTQGWEPLRRGCHRGMASYLHVLLQAVLSLCFLAPQDNQHEACELEGREEEGEEELREEGTEKEKRQKKKLS